MNIGEQIREARKKKNWTVTGLSLVSGSSLKTICCMEKSTELGTINHSKLRVLYVLGLYKNFLDTSKDGEKVRYARIAKGISVEDLAKKLGISIGTIRQMEASQSFNSLGSCRTNVLKELGLTADQLSIAKQSRTLTGGGTKRILGFGRIVRKARLAKNLTQSEVEKLIGIRKRSSNVAVIESRKSARVLALVTYKILKVLDLDPVELFPELKDQPIRLARYEAGISLEEATRGLDLESSRAGEFERSPIPTEVPREAYNMFLERIGFERIATKADRKKEALKNNKDFPDRLKEINTILYSRRKELRLNLRATAAMIGVTRTTIQNVEDKANAIKKGSLESYAKAYDLPLELFIERNKIIEDMRGSSLIAEGPVKDVVLERRQGFGKLICLARKTKGLTLTKLSEEVKVSIRILCDMEQRVEIPLDISDIELKVLQYLSLEAMLFSNPTIGEKFRLARIKRGLTRTQLAQQVGISRPTIHKLEICRNKTSHAHSIRIAVQVAKFLEMDINFLLPKKMRSSDDVKL